MTAGAPAAGQAALLVVAGVTALRVAYLAIDAQPLGVDEAQYWTYSETLAAGYYSKPPLLAWLIRLCTGLLGDTPLAIRLVSPLLHAAIALILFATGRHLSGPRAGFWACLVYLTLPGVTWSAGLASTDPPMLFGWAVALYGLVRAAETPAHRRWWVLAGAGTGLGLLGKYTAIALPFGFAAWLIVCRQWRHAGLRGPLTGLLATVTVAAPNLWWNAANGFPTVLHLGDNANLKGDLFNPEKWLEFVAGQFGIFGPVFFATLLLLLYRWRRLVADPKLALPMLAGLPLLAVITVESFVSRAHTNWAAPMYVGGSVAVAAWLVAQHRVRLLRLGVGINVALGVLLLALTVWHDRAGPALARFTDPAQVNRAGARIGAAVQAARARFPEAIPLFDRRKIMAVSLYYAQTDLEAALMWNPDRVAHNHYEMVSDFSRAGGDRFLYVTESPRPDLLSRFARTRKIDRTTIATHRDRRFDLHFYLLEGFQGYE